MSEAWPQELTEAWLGGHFELVSLGVRQIARGWDFVGPGLAADQVILGRRR